MSIIPNRVEQNVAIAFIKINDPDNSKFDLVNIIKVSLMLIDIAQEENPPSGLIVIIDAHGVSINCTFKKTVQLFYPPGTLLSVFINFASRPVAPKVFAAASWGPRAPPGASDKSEFE